MKKTFILFFLIFSQNIFSQNNNLNRSYEISFCGKPQIIKLIEYKNGTVEGFLQTDLIKEKSNGNETEIIKKTSFSNSLTKKMLTDLKNAGIETLKKCNEDKECEKQGFLDGDHLVIKIQNQETIRNFEFSEIYPESQSNGKLEETKLRRKVQSLVTIIDKEIDLKNQFLEIIKSLKKGIYCYWIGTSKACIYKKNIKGKSCSR